jgi:sec-independent protein translocase protein TatC
MGDLQRILQVLGEGRRRLVRILLVLGPLFGFLLTFKLVAHPITIGPVTMPFAVPQFDLFYNITAQTFQVMSSYLLPSDVQILNVGVADSIVVQMEIAALFTLILGMPWIVHEAGAFLVPALRTRERELITRIGIPATVLFVVGSAIGFLFLTQLTFRLLFRYVAAMGIAPVVGAQQFITFALLYSLAFGVVFELPVFVYTLTRLGVVPAHAWVKHWRGAIIGCLVFGMVVTPDNSGITMMLIALPMIALYFSGAYLATRWERENRPPAAIAVGA